MPRPLARAVAACLLVLSSALPCGAAAPPAPSYLYRVTLVRAAPGKLLDLVALIQDHRPGYAAQGDAAPLVMRHSQGDQWDLLLLFPMESYAAFYHPDRLAQRASEAAVRNAYNRTWGTLVAWQEDLFALGPPLDVVRPALEDAAFYHVEMFQALPGQQEALIREREMENTYLAALDRPQNLIFVRDQGAAWDAFTIGCYRGLQHFAESAAIPLEDEDRAAREAGFERAGAIGPYLRTLIREHHDTLAVAVR